MSEETIRKLVAEELAIKGENLFVKEVYAEDMRDPLDILNWYRNLYYKEGLNTERGVMANAINDFFMQMNAKTERIVESLEERYNDIPIQYETSYEEGLGDGIDYAISLLKGGGVDE